MQNNTHITELTLIKMKYVYLFLFNITYECNNRDFFFSLLDFDAIKL